jgi:hypothetical protein
MLRTETVRSLIVEARRYVSIRHAYFDRGFYQIHVIAELDWGDAVDTSSTRGQVGGERPAPALRQLSMPIRWQ